ncbi:zinc ribbon domain-containing protein [Nitrospirillum iridis]|uniref:RanBP2-type domain-containing protein n=1 Tax=Nitrospirillum iridis TaxID=765888 RepID=A0A7X0EDU5_9PROT|nr:zinc ribbon domain-containing protein [Nitrospirillum iridis]MBB6253167.1 hypothetical protein [Nitrospirillum iridis]
MSATNWQCALCGAVNPGESVFCGNCGTASATQSGLAPGKSPAAGAVENTAKTIGGAAAPEILSSSVHGQRSAPGRLLGGLKVYTGVVTVAERNIEKHTETQSVYGEPGHVVATHTIDTFTHDIRFRLIVQDAGRSLQIPVQVNIDRTFLFVQDGDLVTLIGRPAREGLFEDPAILNHAGRFTMMPAGWRWRAIISAWLAVIGGYYSWSFTTPLLEQDLQQQYRYLFNLLHWGGGIACLVAAFLLARHWWRRGTLKRAVRQITANFGESWTRRRYQNPTGTVEGVFAFSRGTSQPTEWISFRLGLAGQDGKVQDWIAAAAPQRELVTDLRRGDQVELHGRFATGIIHQPRRITLSVGT